MITDTGQPEDSMGRPDPTVPRYLTPDLCRIHLGSHGALHVTVKDERIYGGVYAAYAFPVAHSEEFISLIHSAGEEEIEVGILRHLSDFPPEQASLVRAALARRYFVHTIRAIVALRFEYGVLSLDVVTDKGPVSFMMRWTYDKAVDYGVRGKVLSDVNDNRYLIPDVDALPPKEKAAFQRYIYW